MRWQGRRQSSNVDDRRGISGGGIVAGGGLLGAIILVLTFLLGGDEGSTVTFPGQNAGSPEQKAEEDRQARFVSVVLAETEDIWHEIFSRTGRRYSEPRLVLFSGGVHSACGSTTSATGPFYCPGDHSIYIDLSFAADLKHRFGAPGDFALAYVIAHEVGHHVQTLLGLSEQMLRLRSRMGQEEYNRYLVRMELHADFLAGVWAHYIQGKGLLEEGDIREALDAANAIGDDRLQMESQGYVVPESFTHGTSAQRMYWFRRGFETGDMNQGDLFSSAADP